ncbi:adenosylhomocysteinase, partial [Streptomyces pseudogriseolus]
MPVPSSGTPVSVAAQISRTHLDPQSEEQPVMTTVDNRQDFKVADLSLAEFGRKEITLAEHEMPGLM